MKTQPSLDADLFVSLQRAVDASEDTEALQAITKTGQTEFSRFLTNQIENPRFKVRERTFDIARAHSAIAECQREFEKSSAPAPVLELYQAKLKNQKYRYKMLDATLRGDDQAFCEQSVRVYGRPKKVYFSMIVHHALNVTPTTAVAEKALEHLQKTLRHVSKSSAALPLDILPPVHVEDTVTVNAAAVATIFRHALESESITGWDVVIDTTGERVRFAVNPVRKLVYIPGDTQLRKRPQPMTATAAEALAAHEIGVHARRAHNGSHQPLRLLEVGLDGYLRGEEGLASYVQQQVEGAKFFYGQDRYLAIGLAFGLDGEKRDFRSVFSLMRSYYLLLYGVSRSDDKQVTQRTWDVCRRIFRGTTGQTAGTVYTRDLAYFEGNLAMWDYVVAHPERYENLFIGKFDPLNDRHVSSLQNLGLLPQW